MFSSGLFRSLQQGHSISCPDLLIAMDYCEELLQEIDITSFLLTLCNHVRSFCEHHQHLPTTLEGEAKQASRARGVLVSVSRWEDCFCSRKFERIVDLGHSGNPMVPWKDSINLQEFFPLAKGISRVHP